MALRTLADGGPYIRGRAGVAGTHRDTCGRGPLGQSTTAAAWIEWNLEFGFIVRALEEGDQGSAQDTG